MQDETILKILSDIKTSSLELSKDKYDKRTLSRLKEIIKKADTLYGKQQSAYLINKYILIPTNSTYLQTITFILVIACFVQITELIVKKYFVSLYKALGIYLPLITTNCAVFGIVLNNAKLGYDFITAIVYALGSSLGFVLVLYIFSLLREKIENNDILPSFKGIPIALITAGIIALIFGRLV